MPVEIEKKFLVSGDAWRGRGEHVEIRQGYLSTDPERVVRVRLSGAQGTLTVKGRARGARRIEVEVSLSAADAAELLPLCKGALVEKRRHLVEHAGFRWEVDEFTGENAGLVVAELEVADEADFARALSDPPSWLGAEVSEDFRLSNAALSERPFHAWSDAERRSLRAH